MSFADPPSSASDPRPVRPRASSPRLTALAWLLMLLILLLILPHVAERIQFGITRGQQRAKAEVAQVVLENAPDSPSRFAWVAKRVEPSVVGIETARLVAARSWRDEASYLFPQTGEGSGVIVDEAGYVVTNYHVIDGADAVAVKLADGRTVKDVTVVGADPPADLAVLKIAATGLVAAPWGRSEGLEVGDEVLAIGNPFRFYRTVTAGIISAKGRYGLGQLTHQEFLQTDAAINPGNSGGPLVNMRGEIVGINTAIYGETYRGIGFAIPSDMAHETYKQLRASGRVKPRGWLGVQMLEVTDAIASELGLEEPTGVLVGGVVRGSPADRAGIVAGDVILQWNAEPIRSRSDLSLAVVRTPVGSEATIEILRDGKLLEKTLTVGERPAKM
jgi:serine protease Do